MSSALEPITVVVTRPIRRGSEDAFEEAVKAWIPESLSFARHLGVHMLRPPPGGREYGAVLRFRSRGDWDAFRQAPQYLTFLERIRPFLEGEPRVEAECRLESWFSPLGSRVARIPPRWKMAVVTWLGVCLTVYSVSLLLSPFTTGWPAWLTFATGNAGVVVGLTWLVMPALSRVFEPWLHASDEGRGAATFPLTRKAGRLGGAVGHRSHPNTIRRVQ